MKLTISPDGTITVETPDSPTAAEFVRELYAPAPIAAPKPVKLQRAEAPKRKQKRARSAEQIRKQLVAPKADRPLTKEMDESWAWLAAADRAEGVAADEMAKAFGLSHAGALYRLRKLIDRDMAHKVDRDRYRVGTAELNGTHS